MRKQQVQMRNLLAATLVLEEILAKPNLPGVEGVSLITNHRDPWGYDDGSSYLKHVLCQIQVEFQEAITARYQRDQEIKRGSISDPWKPFRELCSNLLPHLRFERIDATDRNQIRCFWKVHGNQLVDLDDLSSGEKSIIQMFFPLIERDIRKLLHEISGADTLGERPEQCILIDEPELHLHPNLQVKALDYLRVLTSGTRAQVILATHSPTIVEAASFEELFLLRPPELVVDTENQLVQVATDEGKLQVLRGLFGTTSNLTSMQPVVVVEGVHEDDARQVAADRKLYRALHPGFDQVTLIAGGGKSECVALARGLRKALAEFSSTLRAVALVDKDYAGASEQGEVFRLPVTTIENFLLDPDVLCAAIESIVEKTTLPSKAAVTDALGALLEAYENDEVERRAASKFAAVHFYPSRPVTELPAKLAELVAAVTNQYSAEAIAKALELARVEVATLRERTRRREEFHGKDIVKKFFGTYLHTSGLSKDVFSFYAARRARARKSVKTFFDGFFDEVHPKWKVVSDDDAKQKASAEPGAVAGAKN